MTKEEINMVFNWLEKNANKDGLLYFRLSDHNQITAYFKENKKRFAQFYANRILQIIREMEIKDE